MTGNSIFYDQLASSIRGALLRSRDTLIPPAHQFLWELERYLVAYGGRDSAKSWSIVRVLLTLAYETPLRVLCVREFQSSIAASAYQLLVDQIAQLGLADFYTVQAQTIVGANGSQFLFEGLRYNVSSIRSLEGVDVVWAEEAQAISEMSWETLLPTIRKAGSRIFISFNPISADDPVYNRFVTSPPPNAVVRKLTFADNPYRSAESEAERLWLEKTDYDAYKHVWLGEPRTASDALILKGKFVVEPFAVKSGWGGPYHGVDFGFARDPAAAVKCYVDDASHTLYVTAEFWALNADIDKLQPLLESAIPGISLHSVYCDSARPETVSFLVRNGMPSAHGVEKWPGSVADGIAYLRSFVRIVIDPSCKHLLDECRSYSYKQDRLTGAPLPEPEDKNNHLIDALRYALVDLIRAGRGGFFKESALLAKLPAPHVSTADGPVSVESPIDMPRKIDTVFAVAAMSDGVGKARDGIGIVYFGVTLHGVHDGLRLAVLDWDLQPRGGALPGWLPAVFERVDALAVDCQIRFPRGRVLFVPPTGIGETLWQLGLEINKQVKFIGQSYAQLNLTELADAARAYVDIGQVKIVRAAHDKSINFLGIDANHFRSQVCGFNVGVEPEASELLRAWCFGVLLSLENPPRK
jgi:phage terminase large subunit